jgi:hypothetical protein
MPKHRQGETRSPEFIAFGVNRLRPRGLDPIGLQKLLQVLGVVEGDGSKPPAGTNCDKRLHDRDQGPVLAATKQVATRRTSRRQAV